MSKNAPIEPRLSHKLVPLVHIHLVRHGETHENRMGITQGQLDTQLNKTGVRQAEILAEAVRDEGVKFRRAWTSDLARARETAKIILKYHPGVQLVDDSGLRERYLGSLQGTSHASKTRATGYEKSELFMERTLRWWQEVVMREVEDVLERYTKGSAVEEEKDEPDKHTEAQDGTESFVPAHFLAVSHSAYIPTLVRALGQTGQVEIPSEFQIRRCWNTSVSEVVVYGYWTGAGDVVESEGYAEGMCERDGQGKGEFKVFARLERWADVSHLMERRRWNY